MIRCGDNFTIRFFFSRMHIQLTEQLILATTSATGNIFYECKKHKIQPILRYMRRIWKLNEVKWRVVCTTNHKDLQGQAYTYKHICCCLDQNWIFFYSLVLQVSDFPPWMTDGIKMPLLCTAYELLPCKSYCTFKLHNWFVTFHLHIYILLMLPNVPFM